MKKIIGILCIFGTFISNAQYFNKSIAHQEFKEKSIKFQLELNDLYNDYINITNDISNYKNILNSIYVPYEILKTNKVVNGRTSVVKINKITLSNNDRKIKRIILALDNKDLETIYCKWFPNNDFKRIKNEFKEDYTAIIESYNNMYNKRKNRRSNATTQINNIENEMKYEVTKLKQKFDADLRSLDIIERNIKPGTIGFNGALNKYKQLCKEYGYSTYSDSYISISGLRSTIMSRKNSLSDNSYLYKQTKISHIVRNEANIDTDELSEETFKQDKNACINRYYDKIISKFISDMEEKRANTIAKIEYITTSKNKIEKLLSIWNDVSEEQIKSLERYVINKIINDVMGEKFVENTKNEQYQKQLYDDERRWNEQRYRFNETIIRDKNSQIDYRNSKTKFINSLSK